MATTTQEPTDPTVTAAVAAAQQQIDDDEDYVAPEPAGDEPAAPAVGDDPLDVEVPAEKLSGYWKGIAQRDSRKITVRDIMNGADSADEKIRQQGEKANTAVEQVRVLSAQVQAMRDMMTARNMPQEPARRASYEDVGMRDVNGTAMRDPAEFGDATADLGARRARAEIDPRISNLEATLMQITNQMQQDRVRNAADTGMRMANADMTEWHRLGKFLYAAASVGEGGPTNPNNWAAAYNELGEVRPKGAQPRTTLPVEGITRGNPAGSARAVPVAAAPRANKRVRGLVATTVAEAVKAGLKPADAEELAQRTEAILQKREARQE